MKKITPNRIIAGDCIKILSDLDEPIADLIFADPPFNIGYKYDIYKDRKEYDEYYQWTHDWMQACTEKALKPEGSFWIAIGDEYAAEVRIIGNSLGLHLRNWVIWHYTFGQATKRKFARSHTHLFYWVKDPKNFTFRDKAVRILSDRQWPYKDKRANEDGKVPDDVWSEFPRLCGTFGEREGWHGCQMPESILARIIRTCTDPGHTVLDPFAGSGTTLTVAKKTDRKYVGIELSKAYTRNIRKRLAGVRPLGDVEGERKRWPSEHICELQVLYAETRVPTDVLHKNISLLEIFVRKFNWRIEETGYAYAYSVEEVWNRLERLRKAAKLPKVRTLADEPAKKAVRPL